MIEFYWIIKSHTSLYLSVKTCSTWLQYLRVINLLPRQNMAASFYWVLTVFIFKTEPRHWSESRPRLFIFRVLKRGLKRGQEERGGDLGHHQHPQVPGPAWGQRSDCSLRCGTPGAEAGRSHGEENWPLRLLWVDALQKFISIFFCKFNCCHHFPVLKPRSFDQSWELFDCFVLRSEKERLNTPPESQLCVLKWRTDCNMINCLQIPQESLKYRETYQDL